MKTTILFRKEFNKTRFQITQCHWCYIIPCLMFNYCSEEKVIRFSWLFWEFEYQWNLKDPCNYCCGNPNLK